MRDILDTHASGFAGPTSVRNIDLNTRIVERSIVHYTNKERRKRKLKPLASHNSLIRAARGHSRWLARRNGSLTHSGEHKRAKKCGYSSSYVGANLWQSSGRKGTAWKSRFHWRSDWQLGKAAVISWMNSPGHRSWMLNPDHKHIGVGVTRNKRGKIYLAQMLGNPTWGKSPVTHSSRLSNWLWATIVVVLFLLISGTCMIGIF